MADSVGHLRLAPADVGDQHRPAPSRAPGLRLFGAQGVLGARLGGPDGRERGADEGDDQAAEGECDEFGQVVDRDVGGGDAGADGVAHEA